MSTVRSGIRCPVGEAQEAVKGRSSPPGDPTHTISTTIKPHPSTGARVSVATTEANFQKPPSPRLESAGPVPAGSSAPTESHALATGAGNHGERGAAELYREQNTDSTGDVKNLGWSEPPEKIPAPLVGGLRNDELWALIRRFNKQVYHVKATTHTPPGGLDLNVAAESEFSPDKLRSRVERLYMTVIVGLAGAAKHIARLRSWRERRRTAGFCVAYSVAWAFDMVAPLVISTVIVLVGFPPSRAYLFPPTPLALIDASTGEIKRPAAGVLGSHGTLTGAPEKHRGEALEQEAHNFVSTFGEIALSSAAGKHPENKIQEEDSKIENTAPDPTTLAMKAVDAKDAAQGCDTAGKHAKVKEHVEEAMWEKTRPLMDIIGDIADIWERFANALEPTPPFSKAARVRIAGAVLAPALLLSLFANAYIVVKSAEFFLGVALFGDPVLRGGLCWLNTNFSHWQRFVDIRNTLLRGAPTNAQLTITLLRFGEASKAPLPPPPSADVSAPAEHKAENLQISTLHLPYSETEIEAAIHPDHLATREQPAAQPARSKGKAQRLLGFFKGTTKTGVSTALSTDPLRASAGSKTAQNRLGVVLSPPIQSPPPGPVTFPCRFHGKKGTLSLVTSATSPMLAFEYEDKSKARQGWGVAVEDVEEVRKVGGLGWKGKLLIGWSLEREVVDGLWVKSRKGEDWWWTVVGRRDELFNRLVAVGGQRWESW